MAEAIITAVATVIVAIIGALSGRIGGNAVKREKRQDGDSAWVQDIVDQLMEQYQDALQREREQRRKEVGELRAAIGHQRKRVDELSEELEQVKRERSSAIRHIKEWRREFPGQGPRVPEDIRPLVEGDP